MSVPDRVAELLLKWEAAWLAGEDPTVEALCPDRPDDVGELRLRVGLLRKFDAFFALHDTVAENLAHVGPPPEIPGYSVLGVLGIGGMGVVYRVWQEDLEREVAMKVLKGGPNLPPHLAQGFIREARLLANLKHDNLVQVFVANLHEGQPFFVMELIQGGSLAKVVQRFSTDPKGAAELVELVARVVHYAHKQGILHRDLKPANILLDENGRPHVSDFGLAKLFGDSTDVASDGNTAADANRPTVVSDTVKGTPPYMAPEQFRDPNAVTRRTDVWALGVILYELLSGRRPFPGNSFHSYARSVCESAPAPLRSVPTRLGPALEAICLKCLEKDPLQRYASAEALADDLARLLRGEIPLVCRWRRPRQVWLAIRRRPVLMSALLLALATLGAWASVSYVTAPERKVEWVRSEFEHKRAVQFIGATGPPLTYDWDEGKSLATVSAEPDQPFRVSAQQTALVRLWSQPPPAFRLRADVRQENNVLGGQVGVYFNYHPAGPDVPLSCWYAVKFADVKWNNVDPKNQKGSPVRLTFNWSKPDPQLVLAEGEHMLLNGPLLSVPAQAMPGEWRTLEIVVTPKGVDIIWPGDQRQKITAGQFDRWADGLAMTEPQWNGFTFARTQGGAVGLYVRRGTASFRNVVLEPLDSEP